MHDRGTPEPCQACSWWSLLYAKRWAVMPSALWRAQQVLRYLANYTPPRGAEQPQYCRTR